jgi:hypothetical protein
LEVSTAEINPDQDQDISICRDQLLKIVEIIHTVEKRFFLSRLRFFKSRLFESRLGHVEIFVETVETNPDCQDLSRPPSLKIIQFGD